MTGMTRWWKWLSASSVMVGGAIASSGGCTLAQVTPDGTLPNNSIVTPQGNTSVISGGHIAGSNLFHSFEKFSVPTGGEAFFNNAANIQNIFSRVTGKSISNIDGLIRANGTANLFLLNPNGIIFGPNASLNIGGSFVGSTASAVNFADGTQFSATAHPTAPLLTVSVPIGLQYGGNAGSIQVQGNGQGIRSTTELIDTTVGLRVQPNQTLAMVGGNLALEGGTLKTAGGRIELGSVAGPSLVSLTPTKKGFSLGYDAVQNFGNIQLSQQAAVDATGDGSGGVQVMGRRVSLTNGSQIEASNLGSKPGGTLVVKALESVEVIGTSFDGQFGSGFASSVYPGATGTSGDLTINTTALLVSNGAQIATATFDRGNGGNLTVNASQRVQLIGTTADGRFASGLITASQSGATGAAGDLTINTTALLLRDGGQVSAATFGQGNGGNLTVNASQGVQLIGTSVNGHFPSGLATASQSGATGAAGDLTINTTALLLRDGGQAGATTFDRGNGGNLTVNASQGVQLIGTSVNGHFASALATQANLGATGAAGDLTINTRALQVQDRAVVTVSSQGEGNAGNLHVNARSIRLDNFAALSADTRSISAEPNQEQATISLRSEDLVLRRGSNITTNATGQSVGGNINIDTGVLAALEDSDISANSANSFGGRVTINAQGIFGTQFRLVPTSESDITATGGSPELSGTVEINNPDVDPTQGLVELPAELVDASNSFATNCVAGGENEFIITGRGGLPPNPYQPLDSSEVWRDVQLPRELAENSDGVSRTSTSPTITPGRIVEAIGWIVNKNGNVELVANVPTAISQERCGLRSSTKKVNTDQLFVLE